MDTYCYQMISQQLRDEMGADDRAEWDSYEQERRESDFD